LRQGVDGITDAIAIHSMTSAFHPPWLAFTCLPRYSAVSRFLFEKIAMTTTPANTINASPAKRRASATMLNILMLSFAIGLAVVLALAATPARADLNDFIFRATNRGALTIVSTQTGDAEIKLRMVGDATFNADETDLVSLTNRVTVIESKNKLIRRMEFRNEGTREAPKITRRYFINSKETPFDAAAQKWLGGLLPALLRESGWNMEMRVTRLMKNGGTSAVLDDINRIRSSYARSRMIEAFIKTGTLSEAVNTKLLSSIDSIDSDFERKNVLTTLINKQSLSATLQAGVLASAAKMGSSFEQKNVLEAMSTTLSDDAVVMQAWQNLVAKMNSDFERRNVIESLVKRSGVTSTQIDAALEATQLLTSDFERAQALRGILPRMKMPTTTQAEAWLTATRKFNSDFELRGVIVSYIETVPQTRANHAMLFESIDRIRSDFEKRNALEAIAKRMPADAEMVARYRQSARSLSDFERGQAEKAIDRLRL
jgi:hypothetical protein